MQTSELPSYLTEVIPDTDGCSDVPDEQALPRFDGCTDGIFDPLAVEGLIGDTVRWICRSAMIEQPELALLNTLAFAGAVFGRRYMTVDNTRTNIYLVGLARTGFGKDHSRKRIGWLAHKAGLKLFLGANSVRSGAGLARSLTTRASQVMMIDEFGLFLQALSDMKAPTYLREISKMFMTLYSDSSGFYHHGVTADVKDKPIVLVEPSLSIFGTSTHDSYVDSLRKGAIESGSINRFVVLAGRENVEIKKNPDWSDDYDVFKRWERFQIILEKDEYPCDKKDNCQIKILYDPEVYEAVHQMRVEALNKCKGDRLGSLWVRYAENAIKIAMIMAICRDQSLPKISLKDLEFGQEIVKRSIINMAHLAKNNMADNEHEADAIKMLKFISEKKRTKSDIYGKFRYLGGSKKIMELIEQLLIEESITTESIHNAGAKKPTTFYLSVKK